MDIFESICEVIKIMSATFLGASAAFCFDRHKIKIEETNKNYSACLKAQSVIYQYYEVIYNIKHQFLNAFESNPDRALRLKHIKTGQLPFLQQLRLSELTNLKNSLSIQYILV